MSPAQSKQIYSICYCFERSFRMKEPEVPAEIERDLFGKYSENGLMDAEHLHRFLTEVQGEDNLTLEEASGVLESFIEKHSHLNISAQSLSIKEFHRYLLSDSNSPLPHPPKVHQDMTEPLSHYFIYTGHNSYLTGNQIVSRCSEKPIIKALKQGVRAIELDLWPNCKNNNVHIKHGGTWTAPVRLKTCLTAIKEHAFNEGLEYPVILTLEDHLTPELQDKVAQMATEVFGKMLVRNDQPSNCLEKFPSPESWKQRVIISTKLPKNSWKSKSSMKEDNGSVKSKMTLEGSAWGQEIPDLVLNGEDEHQDEKPINAAPEYKHLIRIRAHKMEDGIKKWLQICSQNAHRVSLDEDKLKDTVKAHRVSLDEDKLEDTVKTHGRDIVRFTQQHLMRVYPKGTRIDSSNYNPLLGWLHGAQMVAFNMQGHGRCLWLMQGFFRANGGCGYVKKPDFLMHPHSDNFDLHKLPRMILKVKIYMGEGWNLDFHRTHFDFYSPPDFYVKIGIAGVPSEQGMKRTTTIEDNWNPVWNEEFEFRLSVPELALLRIEVHESDARHKKDDFGGQTCLPVWELRTGIRAVPLYDRRGVIYKSVRLLMRFDFVDA